MGECVLVHIGDGDWIVIDSCRERQSGGPIALEYLNRLGVDVASRIKLVVATHWHDDHIQGLADVLRFAKAAKFVNSAAHLFQDLLRVVKLGATAPPASAATREFDEICKILRQRRIEGERKEAIGPIHAAANKKLLSAASADRCLIAEIHSLSPADGVFSLAAAELQNALTAIQQRRRPINQDPNQFCVVLWLKVGVLNVLLGADLEYVSGATEGWRAIISSGERPPGRAKFFKVPHHGSANADCPECWTDLVELSPIAILTPYSPSKLPKPADITRLCSRAPSTFLTSDPRHYPLPRRDNAVEKTLKELSMTRHALAGKMGHVRVRVDARNGYNHPIVELANGARQQCI